MILQPIGGIANRLRTILSRFEPGMVIAWAKDEEIAGAHFLDAFEPMPVLWIDASTVTREDSPIVTCSALNDSWKDRLDLLAPKRVIRERLDSLCADHGPFDAMHVRRTDHVQHCRDVGERMTTDAEFRDWAKSGTMPLYLATDNRDTQADVFEWVGERLFVGTWIAPCTNGHQRARHTSLAASVVDMWMCARAERFMPSHGSSFSEMIEAMRKAGVR